MINEVPIVHFPGVPEVDPRAPPVPDLMYEGEDVHDPAHNFPEEVGPRPGIAEGLNGEQGKFF